MQFHAPPTAPISRSAQPAGAEVVHAGYWVRVLVIGFVLFLAGVAVFGITGNPNLFPTVVLVGNLLVPVSYVAFFYQRRHLSRIDLPTTARAFLYGGVLGTFAAALLEPIFIQRLTFGSAFIVGLIEEFAKILGVLVVAHRRQHDSELDGLVLGAAAGMGFAALESTGYAFTAFLESGGSLSALVGVTLLRGLLAPIGHGTWTAILASILFRESGRRRFRLDRAVIVAYLAVSILHGLWDGLPEVIAGLFGSGLDAVIAAAGVALIGIIVLWRLWREAVRRQTGSTADAALLRTRTVVAQPGEPVPSGS
jgi:RsiW-degrading membrane proteinase PrsW (M82 family)